MTQSYRDVQDRLRQAGIVISKKGDVHRINFFGGLADTAYYTSSLDDALSTGLVMARSVKRQRWQDPS